MRAGLNALRFSLRAALGFRRGPPDLKQESKTNLFDYLEGAERTHAEALERSLRSRYRLEPLATASSRIDYRDNVYVLSALESVLGDDARRRDDGTTGLRVIDVGSKNFNYAFALERYFARYAGRAGLAALVGVEVDGHVIYRDWRARCDYADAYVAQTKNPGARYVVADFATFEADTPFDVATLLFPFVTRHALDRWGLPARFFAPERILSKALELTPSGHLVVFSQTESERDLLVELLARTGGEVLRSVPLASKLVRYHEATSDRFGTLVRSP